MFLTSLPTLLYCYSIFSSKIFCFLSHSWFRCIYPYMESVSFLCDSCLCWSFKSHAQRVRREVSLSSHFPPTQLASYSWEELPVSKMSYMFRIVWMPGDAQTGNWLPGNWHWSELLVVDRFIVWKRKVYREHVASNFCSSTLS